MGAAAGAIAVAERRIVRAFEAAGATSPATARTPDEVGADTFGIGWRRLTRRAVVRETLPGSGVYYLDLPAWQAVRRTRMRILAALVIILLAFWLYIATMGLLRSAKSVPATVPARGAS
jgi:hypothetical protein